MDKEKEILESNKKFVRIKEIIKTYVKLSYLYSLFCTFYMLLWNNFIVSELGVGNENTKWWVFGVPTLITFLRFRFFSSLWLKTIDVITLTIYLVFISGMIILL